MNPRSSSSGAGWRSEEDYVFARLAVAMGLLDPQAVGPALTVQAQAFAAGQPMSLSQVLVRERRLSAEALLQVKAELARCLRTCPSCGQGRYLAPGPQYREEPCPRCGAAIPVPPTGSTLSASAVQRREAAFRQTATGSQRFERDPFLATSGRPRVFSHYVVEGLLAKGGMGAVYRARHAETGQAVALKVVLAGERATEAQFHRFRREARAQSELDHPNILKIHETGEWEGILYYTMDLVDGSDLARVFPRLELPERVRILALVARAVHHAHEHGYVHRDLKPANVLLDAAGRPLVTDFGLAKNLGGETKLTAEGSVLGTPYYMSPEQATGQTDQIGPRSDIYALGVLLYELATGQLPFKAEAALELYRQIIEGAPRSFADHGVLEPALELIAFKAMAKAPEDRYDTAAAMADDLERWLRGEQPLAQRVSRTALVARQVQRHRRSIGAVLGMTAAGLVVVAGLALAVRVAVRRYRAEQARIAWQDAATLATAALEQARAGPPPDEDAPDPARAARLDQALAEARAAREADPPEGADPGPLDAALAQGLLARAELGLAERTVEGALAARASAAEALSRGGDAVAAQVLIGRAARRLGALDEAAAAAAAALAAAPGDGPAALLAALVELDRAAASTDPAALAAAEAALGALDRDALGRDGLVLAHVARARALLLLGREGDARRALDEALASAPAPPVAHRRAAEACLAAGRADLAAEQLARALELEPRHVPTARALTGVLLGLGRPLEALRLAAPAAREHAPPELEVELLRARLAAGEDVEARLDELAAADAAAALLRADLDAAAGGADPYEALGERDPVARAARARARAARGDQDGARADLDALARRGLPPEGAPHDLPPSSAGVRRARDVGFALLALGDRAGAARAARAALRGAPGDPEATLLLVEAGAAPPDALHSALRRELEELEGPLGRAVLLARLAVHWRRPELAGQARRLGAARAAGQPGLRPLLEHEDEAAAHALGERPTPPAPPPALWAPVLPPRVVRLEASAEDRRAAIAAVQSAQAFEREEADQALPHVERALALDPEHRVVLREYATVLSRSIDYGAEGWVAWVRATRADPAFTFGLVHWIRAGMREAWVYRRIDPIDISAEAIAPAPDDPWRIGVWVLLHHLGALYPDDVNPTWPRAPIDELVRAIDRAVLADPGLVGLLYLRAELTARQGRAAAAKRDLALASTIARALPDAAESLVYDALCRLGVLAYVDPEAALAVCDQVPRAPILGKRYATRCLVWLKEEPALAPLREAPAFKRLLAEFNPR